MRRGLVLFFLAFAIVAARTARSAEETFEVVESKSSYTSQGKAITIERFEPRAKRDGAKTFPAVLVIHGAGGLTVGGPLYRESARTLARNGYVAHIVHYFDLTGTQIAEIKTMTRHFPAWLKVIADGITHVSKQPNVDPKRIGLLGFSLGSYLSLSLSTFDPRVGAVVEYFGGLPPLLAREAKSLPPVLILHGEVDKIVPIAQAKALETVLKEKRAEFEMRLYPSQGHGFIGPDAADASKRSLAFFRRHLAAREIPPTARAVLKPEAFQPAASDDAAAQAQD